MTLNNPLFDDKIFKEITTINRELYNLKSELSYIKPNLNSSNQYNNFENKIANLEEKFNSFYNYYTFQNNEISKEIINLYRLISNKIDLIIADDKIKSESNRIIDLINDKNEKTLQSFKEQILADVIDNVTKLNNSDIKNNEQKSSNETKNKVKDESLNILENQRNSGNWTKVKYKKQLKK